MNFLHAVVLGIVEGLTEFLPVSSTFHLIQASQVLGLENTDYLKLFNVFIQSGAILALLLLYAKTLLENPRLIKHVLLSFLPTALIGFTFYDFIKDGLFESTWLIFWVFVFVGLVFLGLEKYLRDHSVALRKTHADLTVKHALIIGLSQSLSVIPGVSRAGSVIVAMMSLGYTRIEAAKYTFLLSLPTIIGASVLDLYQGRTLLLAYDDGWLYLSLGFVVAFFTAYFVVKWFIAYLSHHTLSIFGWYRLLLALALVLFKVVP